MGLGQALSAAVPDIVPSQQAARSSVLDAVRSRYADSAQSQADPAVVDRSQWDKRADGSEKGMGFLGVMKRPDGNVSTEISVGVEIGGKEIEIPTMVPGLTKDELNYLLNNPTNSEDFGKNMPRSIIQKAVDHARARIAEGKSPFRQDDE